MRNRCHILLLSALPVVGGICLLSVGGLFADPQPAADGASTSPAPLKPGQIDVEHSRVFVHVGKKRLGHEHGVEGRLKSGSIRFGVPRDAGQLEFDMQSFSADGDAARKAVGLKGAIAESTRDKVSDTMRGPAVLDVDQFPTAVFQIESTTLRTVPDKEPVWEVSGRLTLHGESRDLKFDAVRTRAPNGLWNLKGEFTFRQSDYGITPYRALGVVGVADELRIVGELRCAAHPSDK